VSDSVKSQFVLELTAEAANTRAGQPSHTGRKGVIERGSAEGGPINRYRGGDQWLFVVIAHHRSQKTYIGTAAWSNPPAERLGRAAGCSHLQHYAMRFNAVEINSSFYRSHQRDTYLRWAESTPAAFRFSVKAPRSVTHESGLRHCRAELRQFLDEVAGLGGKLGVILVQTPASLAFEAGVARPFFASLTAAGLCEIACEPRHPSWFTPKAEAALKRYGISRVAADPARIAGAGEPGGAQSLIYYRLHGSPKMYYSAYSESFLHEQSEKMKALAATSKQVWCIFDNTARFESWNNGLELRRLMS
jgi:uncharacterized protein YecE (DUF72 family)